MALVLTRKSMESITIGVGETVIKLTVLPGTGGRRFSFEAPDHVAIVRSELLKPGEIPTRTKPGMRRAS